MEKGPDSSLRCRRRGRLRQIGRTPHDTECASVRVAPIAIGECMLLPMPPSPMPAAHAPGSQQQIPYPVRAPKLLVHTRRHVPTKPGRQRCASPGRSNIDVRGMHSGYALGTIGQKHGPYAP